MCVISSVSTRSLFKPIKQAPGPATLTQFPVSYGGDTHDEYAMSM